MKAVWIVTAIIAFFTTSLFAQNTSNKFGVGIKGGFARYDGDVKASEWKPHFGMSIDRWLSRSLSAGLDLGLTKFESNDAVDYFQTDLFYIGADIKTKIINQGAFQPYVLLGIEGFKFNPRDRNEDKLPNNAAKAYSLFQFGFQIGAGLSFFARDNFSIDVQTIYHPTFSDNLDDISGGSTNDTYLTTALKFTFYIGGDQDSDGDGILDEDDKCPGRREDFDGFQDGDGCPDPDNDNDGILDIDDKCPNKPEDVDGFQDKDGCPDPDNDNDAILDVNDKCPGTDETVRQKVDTREDMDGFNDNDGCPDPDNDEDGIPDIKDKCPNKAETFNGWEDEDGCPDVVPDIKIEVGKPLILKGVYFLTGSAKLDPNSTEILTDVFELLRDNPQIEVEIRGHTDNTGSYERNMKLSLERAESVKAFLVKKGIDATRMTTFGFGPDRPIESNDTVEGRAKNRRIVFFRTL